MNPPKEPRMANGSGSGDGKGWLFFERVARISSVVLIPVLLWAVSVEIRLTEHPTRDEVPPLWFREDVAEIKTEVKENATAISEMRTEMNGRLRAIETLLRNR